MGHAPRINSAINNKQASSYIRAEREWRAGTMASSAKGGRPTRSLAYRSSSLSLLRGGRPRDTAVVPGGRTMTPLAGVTQY